MRKYEMLVNLTKTFGCSPLDSVELEGFEPQEAYGESTL